MSSVLQKLKAAARQRWEAIPEVKSESHVHASGAADSASSHIDTVRLLPVASGKGGVGKTNMAVGISVSVGLKYARENKRVLLIDGDLGLPNTDLVLGVKSERNINDLVDHNVDDLSHLIHKTRYPGLDFIAGAEEASLVLGNLYYQQRKSIMGQIQRLKSNLVVFDLGASASNEILDFFSMTSSGIVILNPEPTSVRDGYVFIKNAIIRRVRLELEFFPPVKTEFDGIQEQCGGHFQKIRAMIQEKGSEELRGAWSGTIETFKPMIIVNRVETFHEGLESARKFTKAAEQHLGIHVRYLGSVIRDDAVVRSVKAQRPFRIAEPDCPASKCIEEITKRILNDDDFDLTRNFATFGRIVTSRLLGRPV
ncbi:MAG: P-loop NTPase [Candidatus Hydrogenedentota bacterium]